MIVSNSVKKKDITVDALPQTKFDMVGYQVDGYDDDGGQETYSKEGDTQQYFWEGDTDRGFGTWTEVTLGKKFKDGTLKAVDAIGDVLPYIPKSQLTETESVDPLLSHTKYRVYENKAVDPDSAEAELGLVVSSMTHHMHDIVFIPLPSAGAQIFEDIGNNKVELLTAAGVGTGKQYVLETLDPDSAYHTGKPPLDLGRRYIGTIKTETTLDDGVMVPGVALIDIQGHGVSTEVPL